MTKIRQHGANTASPSLGRHAAAHAVKHHAQRAVAAGNMSLQQFHQVIAAANQVIGSTATPCPADSCGATGTGGTTP